MSDGTWSWKDLCQTCVHGVTEDVDWHDCDKCQDIARAAGKKVIPRRDTFIVTHQNINSWQDMLRPKGLRLSKTFELEKLA